MRYWLLGRKYNKAAMAMEFASEYHTGFRKDGFTPEFHHQICIAHYLRTLPDLRNQEDVLSAAFLHDTVEDYDVSLTDINSRFGSNVRNAVELLSKKVGSYEKNAEEYFYKMTNCPIASIVKGGDRVHNSQTMNGVFSIEKQASYISETTDFILPMLKEARRRYPDQELAYENIKHSLKGQIELTSLSINTEKKLKIIEA